MKKLALTFLYYFVTITIYAQGGIWTWISGDSLPNSAGVFGTQGVPSVINHPPSVYAPCSWKDRQGNFWTYGGTYSAYSDLWKFNPATHEWTWVKGNGLKNQPSVYGTKGIADINNTPGKKDYGSATWVDTAGNFWIMGGGIETSALWKYEINTNMWTWVSGTTVINSGGIYGNKGMPSMLNTPGARRNEAGSTWTDSLNNLWLFGGFGFDVSSYGYQNDLWKYNITTNEWTWMKGDSIKGAPSSYGLQGIANPTNDPGARTTFTRFYDTDGNFWIFGGYYYGAKSDIWKYTPSSNEWIWMSGSTDDDLPGNYNSSCSFDSLNLPASRFEQRAAVTDYCNRFWMYGGFSANAGMLNDLWVFDSQILQWSLLSGSSAINQSGSYGALGVASPNNLPPSRAGAVAWWGNDNKYYLFGGTENNSFTSFSDLWMFDPDTNCIAFDCSLPVVAGFAVSDSTFCEKQCIDFTDISQNNPTSWLWTFSGASPSVSTSQHPSNICYNAFGSFDVSLIACNLFGCDTIIRSNYITSYPTPLDSIWFTNDTLFALPAYSYQWYEVGAGLIANATLNYYVPLTLGNYYCITIDANGCESTSNVIFYTSFFENENNQIASAIWPNPANDVLFINPALLTYNKIVFEIYDMSARIIKHEIIQGSRPIKIDNLAASVYGYRIMSNSNIIAQGRFVKN